MFASVIIDQDTKALDKEFDYVVPDGLNVQRGMRVYVPFGTRILQGFVVDLKEKSDYDVKKLKKIISYIEDYPVIKQELLNLMKFMCQRYHLRLTSVLRLFIPTEMREGKVKEIFEKTCKLTEKDFGQIRGVKQKEIVEYLKEKILDSNSNIYKKGKNYYVEIDNIVITVNSYNYCIITAHKK